LSSETLGFPTLAPLAAFLHGKTRVFPTPFLQVVQKLFFPFLMFRLFFAPLAKLLELYLALNFFAVLAGPVVYPLAGSA